jgi:hypothetical protein
MAGRSGNEGATEVRRDGLAKGATNKRGYEGRERGHHGRQAS